MLFVNVVSWLLVLLKLVVIECDYYSFDGSDNNLEHPAWGSRDRPFQRILGESDYLSYSDGEGEIDDTLPNPRKISNILGQIPITQSKYSNYAPLSGVAWFVHRIFPISYTNAIVHIDKTMNKTCKYINKNVPKGHGQCFSPSIFVIKIGI